MAVLSTDNSSVKPLIATVIGGLYLCAGLNAQRFIVSQNRPFERVIGLLDLPDVTGGYADDACRLHARAQVYLEPSTASRRVGSITMNLHPVHGCTVLFTQTGSSLEDELPTEESGYEIAAAVVHERRGPWFRIAIPKGSAWIQRANAADFFPYPQLLTEKMSYLRSDWDGDMRTAPGGEFPVSMPDAWKNQIPRQVGIDVIGMTRRNNEDWIHVRFAIERCGDENTRTLKPLEGWIRAYRSDGTTAAWFYSRGC